MVEHREQPLGTTPADADALGRSSDERRQELIRGCTRSLAVLRAYDDAGAKRLVIDLQSLRFRLLHESGAPPGPPDAGTVGT